MYIYDIMIDGRVGRMNRKAFTLMEIMASLIIISIVSSIVLPGITNFYSSDKCKAEAEIFVQNIRLARYSAIQEGKLHRIIFSEGGDAYKVQICTEPYTSYAVMASESAMLDDENYNYEDGFYYESIVDTPEVEFNASVNVDLNEITTEMGLNTYRLYFSPDGYIYSSPGTKVTEARVVFSYGSAAIAVEINCMGVFRSRAVALPEDGELDEGDIAW